MAATPFTTPRTWVSQETVTKALLDQQIRDNMLAVAEHVVFQFTATAAASFIDLMQLPAPTGYAHLRLIYAARGGSTALNGGVYFQFSGDTSTSPTFDTATNYNWQAGVANGSNTTGAVGQGATAAFIGYLGGTTAPAGFGGHGEVLIPGYAQGDLKRTYQVQMGVQYDTTTSGQISGTVRGTWNSTSPIRAIKMYSTAGNLFSAGAVISILGVRSTSTST